jgi:hypothetical protein
MTFKIKGAIFKNTAEKLQQRLGDRYDASKKYPDVDGVFGIREEDRMAFASYIMNAAVNDKGEVPLRVNGYNNTSQSSGVKYLGLTIEPDFKTLKAIEEALLAAVPPAAAALVPEVVNVAQDDLF